MLPLRIGACAVPFVAVACQSVQPQHTRSMAQRAPVSTVPPAAPAPIHRDRPARVIVALTTEEHRDTLADGVTYVFWTFNRTVPGPLVRIRVGDTVELRLTNDARSRNVHSINLHAVSGPGGGAWETSVGPGETRSFEWVALNPGLFVYHCHTPSLAVHISNGMYGLILVEPEGGLGRVDREYYLVKGEMYTTGATGQRGFQGLSAAKLRVERPEYVVWNGRHEGLMGDHALHAKVGETVRLFIGNAGPNLTMSFHVVGEVFDRVYTEGGIGSEPVRNVQTTQVPSGGSTIVEFKVDVPGVYHIVDHSYSRLDKGAIASLEVTGTAVSSVFRPIEHVAGP